MAGALLHQGEMVLPNHEEAMKVIIENIRCLAPLGVIPYNAEVKEKKKNCHSCGSHYIGNHNCIYCGSVYGY